VGLVEAPAEAAFEALADARTYPDWWGAVYLDVVANCLPQVGCVSKHEFKGRLPYTSIPRRRSCAWIGRGSSRSRWSAISQGAARGR
jgi:hypothetical protein